MTILWMGLIALSIHSFDITEFWVSNLKHTHPLIRRNAALYLGELANPISLIPLIEALTDTDPLVRYTVVRSIRQFADIRALGPLTQLANQDPDFAVRSAARQAIETIRRIHEKKELKKEQSSSR